MKEAVEKVEREMEGGGKRKRGWWDEKCKEVKREVRKLLRNWRKGGRQEYKGRRKEYKEMCERKKEEAEELVKRAEEARTEGPVGVNQ